MTRKIIFLLSILIIALSVASTGCPIPGPTNEKVKAATHIGALDEATHSRDLAIKAAIEANITSDPVLKWYSATYGGLDVQVSHANATITMKVKTQAQHDQIISLAKQAKDIRDVVDNITIDDKLDDPPFEW